MGKRLVTSAKYLNTFAKIVHKLTYSRLVVKIFIKPCLFLLHTNLFNFFDRNLGMKNLKHQNCQERIQLAKQTTLLLTTTSQLFTLTDTLSFFDVLGIGQHKELNLGHDSLVMAWLC